MSGDAGVITVAVDGSESSAKALRWAAEEARLRHATLRVVHAWMIPALGSAGTYLPVEVYDQMPKDAAAILDQQVADVLGEQPDIELERQVVEGLPSNVVLKAAQGAEMVVVGSRGHGGFTGMLLGSVSTALVHHAPCPVVVVRS